MPRINIEDSLRVDPRFRKLIKMIGEIKAYGAWVIAAQTAQEFYKQEKMIPIDIFEALEHSEELLGCGLATKQNEANGSKSVYLKGSKDYFSWLSKRVEAGRLGGKSKKNASNKNNNLNKAKSKQTEASTKQTQASCSTSYSISKINKSNPIGFDEVEDIFGLTEIKENKQIQKPPKGDLADADLKNKIRIFIGCYVKAFQSRYSTRPDLSGKRLGQLKNVVKGAENFDELCELVQAFCQSNDSWFCTKMHDIETFAENLGKIRVMMNSGMDAPEFIKQKNKDDFWDNVNLT
jgi:hypothetical protein